MAEQKEEKCPHCGIDFNDKKGGIYSLPMSYIGNLEYCLSCGKVKDYRVIEIHSAKVSE